MTTPTSIATEIAKEIKKRIVIIEKYVHSNWEIKTQELDEFDTPKDAIRLFCSEDDELKIIKAQTQTLLSAYKDEKMFLDILIREFPAITDDGYYKRKMNTKIQERIQLLNNEIKILGEIK